jgi:hypothetical protein
MNYAQAGLTSIATGYVPSSSCWPMWSVSDL